MFILLDVMKIFSKGYVWGERMVFFQPQRSEVPERSAAEPGRHVRVLEGDRDRQTGDCFVGREPESWCEEGSGFLRWKASERDQN